MANLNESQAWLDAIVTSANDMATTTMGFDGCFVGQLRQELPENLSGSCVSLVGKSVSVQIGVFSTNAGCLQMAEAMLGMTPGEADLPKADVADAIREVVNIVGGGIKRLLCNEEDTLQLGLPMFLSGYVEFGKDQECVISDAKMGPVEVVFMILRKKT